MYYVYILKCIRNDKFYLYTGYTTDLKDRFVKHKRGDGAKFTRAFKGNIELVYYETYDTKSEAMSREWHIKHDYTASQKRKMIARWDGSIPFDQSKMNI
jgi:putative endonuclease